METKFDRESSDSTSHGKAGKKKVDVAASENGSRLDQDRGLGVGRESNLDTMGDEHRRETLPNLPTLGSFGDIEQCWLVYENTKLDESGS